MMNTWGISSFCIDIDANRALFTRFWFPRSRPQITPFRPLHLNCLSVNIGHYRTNFYHGKYQRPNMCWMFYSIHWLNDTVKFCGPIRRLWRLLKTRLFWRIGKLPLRWICNMDIDSVIFPFLIRIRENIMVKRQNSKHSIFLPISKLEFSYTITVHMLHFWNDTTTIMQMTTEICYWQRRK